MKKTLALALALLSGPAFAQSTVYPTMDATGNPRNVYLNQNSFPGWNIGSVNTGTGRFAPSGGGTVTSVGATFTGGLISITGSPVTTTGTFAFTVAGTSGGIPCFTSASGWASSSILAANAIITGGGAGVCPATVTTGTGVLTALGTNVGTAGSVLVNGGVLGTPSSGTLTNATGLPIAGLTGLGTGVGTLLAATPTGSGGTLVESTSPTISGLTVTGSLTATGLVTNSDLANPATTVNGQTCTLGSTCTIATGSTITVGTTAIASGIDKGIIYDNAGVVGNLATANNGFLATNGSGIPSVMTGTAALDNAFGTTQGSILTRGASTWTANVATPIDAKGSYGVKCDGSTNDTPTIQAAINAAQVAGGIVQLPAGQCVLNSGLTITAPIIFQGVGMGAASGAVSNTVNTQILANFGNGDVIAATTIYGVVFRDFQINSSVGTRNSGAGIHIKSSLPSTTTNSQSIITNVAFSSQFYDIQCTVCSLESIYNTYHQAFASTAILIDYVAGGVESGGGFISWNHIFGNDNDYAIVTHVGYEKITHNIINNIITGVAIIIDNRAAGNPVIAFNSIENCIGYCITVQNSGGIGASMLQIVNNEFSTFNATSAGAIQVLSNAGGTGPWIDTVDISNNIGRNSLTLGAGSTFLYNIQTGKNLHATGNITNHLSGDTSNTFIFGAATDVVGPVLVANNTDSGSTTGVKYYNSTAQLTFVDLQGLAFASLPSLAANGSQIFVTDGAPATGPCTGASTGSMATRQNGAWKCF